MKKYMLYRFRTVVGVLFCSTSMLGLAQQSPDINREALAAKEKQWKSCEGGYYTGPRDGRRNYSNDKYLWVVTPQFARSGPTNLNNQDKWKIGAQGQSEGGLARSHP